MNAAEYGHQLKTAGGAVVAAPYPGSLAPPQIAIGTDTFTGSRPGSIFTEIAGGTPGNEIYVEHWVTFGAPSPPNGAVPSETVRIQKVSGAPIQWVAVKEELKKSKDPVWHNAVSFQYQAPPTTPLVDPAPGVITFLGWFIVNVLPNGAPPVAAGALLREKAGTTFLDTWVLSASYVMPSTSGSIELVKQPGAKTISQFIAECAARGFLNGTFVHAQHVTEALPYTP